MARKQQENRLTYCETPPETTRDVCILGFDSGLFFDHNLVTLFLFFLAFGIQIFQSHHLWIAFCSPFRSLFFFTCHPTCTLRLLFVCSNSYSEITKKIFWPPSAVGWTPSLKYNFVSAPQDLAASDLFSGRSKTCTQYEKTKTQEGAKAKFELGLLVQAYAV